MQTFVQSAGKKTNEDYLWWERLSDNTLLRADKASAVNILTDVALYDDKFTILLRRKVGRLSLVLYLPSNQPLIAIQKKQRIDFTGGRSIRNGFIWLANSEEEDKQLRKLTAGLLQKPLEELIDTIEACFFFTQEPESSKRAPGFGIDAKGFSEFIECLKTVEVSCEVNAIKDDVLQIAHDNPARRKELCARLLDGDRSLPQRDLLVLVCYFEPAELLKKYREQLWCLLTAQVSTLYTENWQIIKHNEVSMWNKPVDAEMIGGLIDDFGLKIQQVLRIFK